MCWLCQIHDDILRKIFFTHFPSLYTGVQLKCFGRGKILSILSILLYLSTLFVCLGECFCILIKFPFFLIFTWKCKIKRFGRRGFIVVLNYSFQFFFYIGTDSCVAFIHLSRCNLFWPEWGDNRRAYIQSDLGSVGFSPCARTDAHGHGGCGSNQVSLLADVKGRLLCFELSEAK